MASRAERARSFGSVAEDYDRLRSGPAAAAVEWMLPAPCPVAVDLGAGTGLLSRALASEPAVGEVIAVEPDERMRTVLLRESAGVRVLAGRGESIPLPDASVDGVFISSAWHWMDPDQASAEIARVLRDGGRLGLIWTGPDHEVEWLRELRRSREPAVDQTPEEPEVAGGARRWREMKLPEGAPMERVQTAQFRFTRTMTSDDVLDLLGTYSGVITASPDEREARMRRSRALLEHRFPGAAEIVLPMRSLCWRADRVSR